MDINQLWINLSWKLEESFWSLEQSRLPVAFQLEYWKQKNLITFKMKHSFWEIWYDMLPMRSEDWTSITQEQHLPCLNRTTEWFRWEWTTVDQLVLLPSSSRVTQSTWIVSRGFWGVSSEGDSTSSGQSDPVCRHCTGKFFLTFR